jgi:O-antigen ligase
MRFLETPQARLVAGFSALAIGLGAALALQSSAGVGAALAFIALGAALTLINLHDLDCLILGKCHTYGWTKAVLITLLLVLFCWIVVQALAQRQDPFQGDVSWRDLWSGDARRKTVEHAAATEHANRAAAERGEK